MRAGKTEILNDNRQNNHGNRLRTYRKFKTDVSQEPYLDKCGNSNYRHGMGRLRLSSHSLHIETGIYYSGQIG